jgi:hypothetical protein
MQRVLAPTSDAGGNVKERPVAPVAAARIARWPRIGAGSFRSQTFRPLSAPKPTQHIHTDKVGADLSRKVSADEESFVGSAILGISEAGCKTACPMVTACTYAA